MASRGKPKIPARSRLAIVGAGPVGLEMAALAAAEGWDVVLFERGRVGENILEWGHVTLFSPFGMNHSRWGVELLRRDPAERELPGEDEILTGRDYVRRYLEPLSRAALLRDRIFTGTRVLEIGRRGLAKRDLPGSPQRARHPFRLLLRRGERECLHHAEYVVDASGVFSHPQYLGNGNIPAPGELRAPREHLHYGLPDILEEKRALFAGRHTLLVGGGHSAATSLEALERLVVSAPTTRVTWILRSLRCPPYQRIASDPLARRDRLSRNANRLFLNPPPWLTCLAGSWVDAFLDPPGSGTPGFRLRLDTPDGPEEIEADEIIAATGFGPDRTLYRQLQVHECYATAGPMRLAATLLGASADCLAQPAAALETLVNPEPGLFILGNKSYGTNPAFLIRVGIEQVETVFAHLRETSKPCRASNLFVPSSKESV